jgi:PAS domain S-box-containing protein/putative nucleotidyltransferase with HDIG domain
MARVLIVDDELSIRDTLSEFVREEGHGVLTAEDAGTALEIVCTESPDVVVTDIILPRVTGVELLRQVHETAPDVQVIMITGEPTAETAAEAVRLGAFDYLSKPILRDGFKSSLASALRVAELAKRKRELEEQNLRYRQHLEEEVEKKTAALRASEERFRRMFELSPVATVYVGLDGGIILCNEQFTRIHATRDGPEAQVGRHGYDFVPEEEQARFRTVIDETVAAGRSLGLREVTLLREDGTAFPAELDGTPVRDDRGEPVGLIWMAVDVSERRRSERAEQERQERIRQANEALLRLATQSVLYEGNLDGALDSIVRAAVDVLDVEHVGVWLAKSGPTSTAAERFYVRGENRYRVSDILVYEETPVFFEALRTNRVLAISDIATSPLMTEFDIEKLTGRGISSVLDAAVFVGGEIVGDVTFEHVGERREWTHEEMEFAGEIASLVALTIESSQRRQAEEALDRREKEYEALFEDSPASLWYEDFSEVKAYLDDLRASGVEDLRAHFHDHPEAIEECIRRIRVVAVNETAVKMHGASAKEDLLGGFEEILTDVSRASIGEQLIAIWNGARLYETTTIDQTLGGEPRPVALRWVVPAGYEDSLERVLLAKVDISAVAEAEQALRRALDGTIEAIGLTTETRDPYTAGHQQRVTELAVAIAEDLGLEADRIEGTRAAGLMHDIGKMAIPAEILSKPSRLTDMEMALIQSHPQVAYDILKSVTFPWPLAEIVLQHHERIDGSGYPQGLRGEEILPEARILAVADTVEAMASHRPYRASLGIDAALSEIESHRGSHYDPNAVDACLRLFREGRFAFRDAEGTAA